jgi:hypothetical protein
MKRAIAVLLVIGLSTPAMAGPIADGAARAAATAAAQGRQGATGAGTSRRDWLGMTLVGTGIGFMAAGFSGGGSRTPNGGTSTSGSSVQTTESSRNTALGLIGVGLVGGGLALLFVHRPQGTPELTFGAHRVAVRETITF